MEEGHVGGIIWGLFSVVLILFFLDLFGIIGGICWFWEKLCKEVAERDKGNVQTPASPEQTEPFDWNAHNKLGHEYITSIPPNLRKAMEQADIMLQHCIMDSYILNTLSDWQIDKNPSTARTTLLKKSQPFPDLRALNAACLLTIGDLFAMEGKRKEAIASFLKVDQDSSMPSQYRMKAQERLSGLKQRSYLPDTLLPEIKVGKY